ncbi:copper resistance protein NlpE N-terminal domain-containing protein [Bizionia echini]|uniref:copper resistance protein NlpE N-terminal domain-containing protein n=1 Tax=Bizionia echini TaxID=649333 RepID=UPI0030DD963E
MKKHLITFAAIALVLSVSCKSDKENNPEVAEMEAVETEKKPDMHTSQNSLDWKGTYVGILPCADCEGIKTTLRLNEDMSYEAVTEYLGKKDGVFDSRGYYKWEDDGQNILLSDENETKYKVGENKLIQLDKSGNVITGELAEMYILKKQDTSSNGAITFTDTKWKLVKLMGQEITDTKAFISFSTEDNRVFGNASCNNFNGTFEIENELQIKLSKMATTMMACPDMSIEKQFLEVLEKVDNVSLNGKTMTLNKAKMAPLAVFEAVE